MNTSRRWRRGDGDSRGRRPTTRRVDGVPRRTPRRTTLFIINNLLQHLARREIVGQGGLRRGARVLRLLDVLEERLRRFVRSLRRRLLRGSLPTDLVLPLTQRAVELVSRS